ncbi:hypothetical protein HF319_00255, partial [Xanthomonas sp. Kuri4-1]
MPARRNHNASKEGGRPTGAIRFAASMLKIICLAAALGVAAGSPASAADLEFEGRQAQAEA